MKVLQINSVCGIGSTGRIATDIHNILLEQGHKSYIAYGRDLPKNCNNVIRIGTKFDNYTHVVKTRVFDKHGFGSKRATLEFIAKVKEIDPDIIHIHNIHGYYLNIEIFFNYLKEVNKPVVWTLHDCWSFTGHCSHFDYIGCEKWKTGCFDCPQKKEYPKSYLRDCSKWNYEKKRELFNGVQNLKIATPSKWLAEMVKKSFLNEYEIKVINNGIDLSVFRPTESNFRKNHKLEDKFIILGVANVWNFQKGLYHFIELAKKLSDEEVIVLVGLSKKQLKTIPDKIIGITKTKNVKELVEIYSSADVFVNPTLEDNFPTTNIEALACGTPIITFDTGGSVEIIDETTGLIVMRRTSEELYKNFSIIKSRERSLYEKACINRAIKLYSKDDRLKEYIYLYKDILNNKI